MKLEQERHQKAQGIPHPHAFAKRCCSHVSDVPGEQFLASLFRPSPPSPHGRTDGGERTRCGVAAFSRRYSAACGSTDRGTGDRPIVVADGPNAAAWRTECLVGCAVVFPGFVPGRGGGSSFWSVAEVLPPGERESVG
jgi:hypothetical protein